MAELRERLSNATGEFVAGALELRAAALGAGSVAVTASDAHLVSSSV
jgi:hypothetical protein